MCGRFTLKTSKAKIAELIGLHESLPLFEPRFNFAPSQPVHAIELGEGRFRLLYSPGFVQGIAAGDEFRLLDHHGAFEVTRHAGNVAVQVFRFEPLAPLAEGLVRRVAELGGVLDGQIERGMVFTIPITAGFPAIESVFNEFVSAHPGTEWMFGNVYDTRDGVTPLNWWVNEP
jgi:hypothetical protein